MSSVYPLNPMLSYCQCQHPHMQLPIHRHDTINCVGVQSLNLRWYELLCILCRLLQFSLWATWFISTEYSNAEVKTHVDQTIHITDDSLGQHFNIYFNQYEEITLSKYIWVLGKPEPVNCNHVLLVLSGT